MIMAFLNLKRKYFGENVIKQLLTIILFKLAIALATSATTTANRSNATIYPANPLGNDAATPKESLNLLAEFTWGHNTKYSTILLDENISVKAFSISEVKYPQYVSDYILATNFVCFPMIFFIFIFICIFIIFYFLVFSMI